MKSVTTALWIAATGLGFLVLVLQRRVGAARLAGFPTDVGASSTDGPAAPK